MTRSYVRGLRRGCCRGRPLAPSARRDEHDQLELWRQVIYAILGLIG